MLVLVPFILNLYTENGTSNDDLPVPPLFDIADDLNGILAMLTPQSLPEGIPPPVVIAPEDAVEGRDGDEIMEEWVELFIRYLTSTIIGQAMRTEAVDAFVSLVSRLAEYDSSLSYEENVHGLFWLLKHWQRLHVVCPAISPILYNFLGNGECHWCNGCHQHHLYFDPDRRDNHTFVLVLDDGSIFEADEDNVCKGEYCTCEDICTIMRCSDGQAFDECCNIGLCDGCWPHHYCNREGADS